MTSELPYGQGSRMLELAELCEWLNIKPRHARKLVERGAIPYRKVGRLLRFSEAEVEQWSRPRPRRSEVRPEGGQPASVSAIPRRPRARVVLPKSLIDQEAGHGQRQSA